jgi:hypothetical protein
MNVVDQTKILKDDVLKVRKKVEPQVLGAQSPIHVLKWHPSGPFPTDRNCQPTRRILLSGEGPVPPGIRTEVYVVAENKDVPNRHSGTKVTGRFGTANANIRHDCVIT